LRLIFFGTSSFAASVLAFLLDHSISVVAVVTRADRPRGRHLHEAYSPVKQVALDRSLPIHQPEKISTPEYVAKLTEYDPDLFLVVAYGEIIKKAILDIPKIGSFNIHASLLPKYRGAAPIQRALMNAERKTGINIIEMTPQMDAGDVVAAAEVAISDEMTFGELEKILCDTACHLTLQFLNAVRQGKISKIPQNHAEATFAPKILAPDMRIDWSHPARALYNLIRALSPQPGAWCPVYFEGEEKRLKIRRAKCIATQSKEPPGTLLKFCSDEWLVACGEGVLQLLEVQLEGKKNLSTEDFIKGIHKPISFILKTSN
jgi:methionyl-tRNA formyltransferase